MDISKISSGREVPWDVNVIVEIPLSGGPVKYEIDKESGALVADRLLRTAMHYPCNYGFIPHTLSADGDPIDVLVATDVPLAASTVLRCRPIGVLKMSDEAGKDEKILAVPHAKFHPDYAKVQNYTDLPQDMLKRIKHFFERYKDLDEEKWTKVDGWGDMDEAALLIEQAVKRAASPS